MSKGQRILIVAALLFLSIWGKVVLTAELVNNDHLWIEVIPAAFYISLENLIYIADAFLGILVFKMATQKHQSIPLIFGLAVVSTILYMIYMMALNYSWQSLAWNAFWRWTEPIYTPFDFALWGLWRFLSTGHPRYYLVAGMYFAMLIVYQYLSNIFHFCTEKFKKFVP